MDAHLRPFEHLSAMPMKTIWMLLYAGLISLPAAAADDTWVGRYRTNWIEGSRGTEGEVSIVRAADATPAAVVGKIDADLARWSFFSPGKNQIIVLRRFLPDDYAGLNSAEPTECLGGKNVALCYVKPGTVISFDGGGPIPEKFVARTGYFGIFTRNGAAVFELTKLNSIP